MNGDIAETIDFMPDERGKQFAFNIVIEAKMRAMIYLTKKYHPDWTDS